MLFEHITGITIIIDTTITDTTGVIIIIVIGTGGIIIGIKLPCPRVRTCAAIRV
jgi:hypothetical protein